MDRRRAVFLAFIVAFLIYPSLSLAANIYVDRTANGDNSGSDWANAYTYLQDALGIANSGDNIWVAEGVYQPDRSSANPAGSGDRTSTFRLRNGVAIYGGFACGGSRWEERDPNAHITVLSGDLANNDANTSNPSQLLTDANRVENSYHVVNTSGTDIMGVLDGFTIQSGNANMVLNQTISKAGACLITAEARL